MAEDAAEEGGACAASARSLKSASNPLDIRLVCTYTKLPHTHQPAELSSNFGLGVAGESLLAAQDLSPVETGLPGSDCTNNTSKP